MRITKSLLTLSMICTAAVMLEAVSFMLYAASEGKAFSYRELAALRASAIDSEPPPTEDVTRNEATGLARDALADLYIMHPYLGFVRRPERQSGALQVTPYGFYAEQDPLGASSDPDIRIVGITGGSVAEDMVKRSGAILHRYFAELPQFKGKKIVIAMLGMAAFKQPQQLLSVAYYLSQGGRLDMLINLDGKNEATDFAFQVKQGIYPLYPYFWASFFSGSASPNHLAELGDVIMYKRLRRYAAGVAEKVHYSITASLLWLELDRYFANRAALAETHFRGGLTSLSNRTVTGPDTVKALSDEQLRGFQLQAWQQASLQLQALAKANHFAYFHFLQPNQYTDDKPLSAREKENSYNAGSLDAGTVRDVFPRMKKQLAALQAAGVAAYDLTGLYRGHSETLYVDSCCHVNQLGNNLLAQAIGSQIVRFTNENAAGTEPAASSSH